MNVKIADYSIPLGKGDVICPGKDLTLVAWGAMAYMLEKNIEEIQNSTSASIELIDLRTILPWDRRLVINV